jgi:hypothetical protein
MRKRGALRGWPAAEILAGFLFDAEQRAKVRDHIAATGVPLARLAREIGLSEHRFRAFLDGAELWSEEQDRLDRWCEDKPLVFVHAEEVAVLILTSWGTIQRRAADRRALADAVLRVYQERGFRVPPFVEDAITGP